MTVDPPLPPDVPATPLPPPDAPARAVSALAVPWSPSGRPHLGSIVDESLLADAIDRGLVSVRAEGPLRILNYTPRATYDRAWNQATLTCRGLIVDADDRVVARPFPKFFGPAEPDAPPVPEGRPMVVTGKLDGSLGIAYHHAGGGIRVATRGSLSSDQATEATNIWHEKYAGVRLRHGVTPLFEIIYPGNRIVTDYGDMRDLVLLAVIDVYTGADLPLDVIDWPGPRAPRYDLGSLAELVDHVSSSQESAREGYVVRSVRADLPEEFWPWYDACVAEFHTAAERLIGRYESLVDRARRESAPGDDRSFAEAVIRLSSEADLPSGPMFAIARRRAEAYPSIWVQLRPHGTGDTPRDPSPIFSG